MYRVREFLKLRSGTQEPTQQDIKMARGINKVILVGHLGQDPEVKYMPSGQAVCNITLATTESWTDKNSGEKVEKTEWHRVVFFRRLAEIAGEYLRKGSQVYVEGRLQTRKWQDQGGNDRYTTEIVANDMQMLGSKGSTAITQEAPPGPESKQTASSASSDEFDDDIPF